MSGKLRVKLKMAEIIKIGAGDLQIGRNVNIGNNVKFIFKREATVYLGDNVSISDNVKFVVEGGVVAIGDWTTIHDNTLVLCKAWVKVGQHCWFGQNSILDGTGGLTIQNGVRVGMYSQIWTHVAAGELIEGCRLFAEKPVIIKRDAWLVGSCTVSSGVTIGERCVCLNGSNITKSIHDFLVVSGSPAIERKGLKLYKDITLDKKFSLMEEWSLDYVQEHPEVTINKIEDNECIELCHDGQKVIIFKRQSDYNLVHNSSSDCLLCVESKAYNKRLTALEISFLKYLAGNKARFYFQPENQSH